MKNNHHIAAKFIFLFFLSAFSFLDLSDKRYFGKEQGHNLYTSNIIEAYNALEKADEDFLNKITFEIADNQPALGGGSVKFVLDGSDGNKWLFKNMFSKQSIAAFKLARLFGINSPEVYPASLVINGCRHKGLVQRYIERWPRINSYQRYDFLEQNQEELIKLQIFHWLVNKREDTFYHLMLDEENKVNSIDLKLTLEYPEETLPASLKEKFYFRKMFPNYRLFYHFWDKYLAYFGGWGLRVPSGFMYYVENFSSDYIAGLLEEYGIAEPDINKLIAFKQSITGDYGRFLLFVQGLKKTGLNIEFDDSPQEYALSVLNKLKARLKDKQKALKSMPDKEQGQLNVVTAYFFKKSLCGKANKQVLSIIGSKREEALNIYELLGLYLLEAQIIKNIEAGTDENDIFSEAKNMIALNRGELSLPAIEGEIGCFPEGTRLFITALYHAVKGEFPAALESLRNSAFTAHEKTLLLSHIEKTAGLKEQFAGGN